MLTAAASAKGISRVGQTILVQPAGDCDEDRQGNQDRQGRVGAKQGQKQDRQPWDQRDNQSCGREHARRARQRAIVIIEIACWRWQAAQKTRGAGNVVDIIADLHGGLLLGATRRRAKIIVLARFDNYTVWGRASCAGNPRREK